MHKKTITLVLIALSVIIIIGTVLLLINTGKPDGDDIVLTDDGNSVIQSSSSQKPETISETPNDLASPRPTDPSRIPVEYEV